jgi:hypothetical protein
MDGETVDVSMDGLLVRAPKAIPVGSSVNIRLHLSPDVKPVIGAGCVVRLTRGNQWAFILADWPSKKVRGSRSFSRGSDSSHRLSKSLQHPGIGAFPSLPDGEPLAIRRRNSPAYILFPIPENRPLILP